MAERDVVFDVVVMVILVSMVMFMLVGLEDGWNRGVE
jgi:hypothetical protein